MKKFILVLGMIGALSLQAFTADTPLKLSEKGQISLLTCDPGKALYSAFGHSAIRVKDPVQELDVVYNYGTFNFDQPNFYMKFIRGKLDYYLAMTHYKYFLMAYERERREIREQILNLSQEEANNVFAFLQYNHKPENRYYRYDFFFDNCATRIRDVFTDNLQDALIFDKTIAYSGYTFRDLLDQYLDNRRWAQFGINIVLGSKTDRIARPREYMFLPDYVEKAFDGAILKEQGRIKPFVEGKRELYSPEEPLIIKNGTFTPDVVFWGLFLLLSLVMVYEVFRSRHARIVDGLLFIVLGLAGMLITFLWWGTDHSVTDLNWNIIWAFPLHFFAGIWLLISKKSTFLAWYFLITGSLTFFILPLWGWIPQRLDAAFLPLILIITGRAIRSFMALRINHNQ